MQVTEVTKEGLRSEYQFTIPSEKITSELDARYAELAKTEKRQGFRPGKVPLALVKTRYRQAVENEVVDLVARDTIDTYLKEKNIRPATAPAYKVESYTEGSQLVFSVVFEAMPEMAEIDLESIKLENIVADIPDSLVDEMLEHFVKSKAEYTPKPDAKKVKKDDAVEMDFEGFMDGVAFEGGAGTNHRLVIGSNSFIPGFEDQLIGKAVGEEVEVQVTFPTEYHHAPLAGKEATFKVTIHQILAATYPEKNDDFAKSLTGFGAETMEELRKKMAAVVGNRYHSDIQLYLKKQLFDALDKKLDFALPETMVDAQFQQLWQTALAQKEENPDFMKKPEDEVKTDYLNMAKRRVKLGLYLLELGRIHNINLTEEEIRQAIAEQMQRFPGQEQQILNYFRNNQNAIEELKGPMFEDKMADFVLAKAAKKDKSIKLDDIPAYLEKVPGLQEVA